MEPNLGNREPVERGISHYSNKSFLFSNQNPFRTRFLFFILPPAVCFWHEQITGKWNNLPSQGYLEGFALDSQKAAAAVRYFPSLPQPHTSSLRNHHIPELSTWLMSTSTKLIYLAQKSLRELIKTRHLQFMSMCTVALRGCVLLLLLAWQVSCECKSDRWRCVKATSAFTNGADWFNCLPITASSRNQATVGCGRPAQKRRTLAFLFFVHYEIRVKNLTNKEIFSFN